MVIKELGLGRLLWRAYREWGERRGCKPIKLPSQMNLRHGCSRDPNVRAKIFEVRRPGRQ